MFADEVTPQMLEIAFLGGMAGEKALPVGMRALINWNYYNRDVIDWLSRYRTNVLRKITRTTQTRVVNTFSNWIRAGDSLPVLEKMLTPIFGEARAAQIAVTETTRIYAEGNLAAWKASGLVGGSRWNTGQDELVCPICAPLDGQIAKLGEGFGDAEGILAPPAHVNCRCYLTPVVDNDLVRGAIRRSLEEE